MQPSAEGIWDGETFHVDRVKLRNAGKNPDRIRLSGAIRHMSFADRRLQIGPVNLNWQVDQDADISNVGLGDALEVNALKNSFGAFSILSWKKVALETPDTLELIGAVTNSSSDGEPNELFLAGIPMSTPRRLYSNGRMRLHRQDDRRPADQMVIEMGSVRVTIGGELELEIESEGDHDLDSRVDDRVIDTEQQVQLEAFFEIGESVSAFAELKVERSQEFALDSQDGEIETRVRRGETWVYFDQPLGLPAALQIGRQNFAEKREWWWDTDLDAVRVYVNTENLNIEIGIAEELAPADLGSDRVDAEDDDIFRLLGHVNFRINSALVVDLFYLHQNDHSATPKLNAVLRSSQEDEDDAELTWTGLRLSGEFRVASLSGIEYWVDLAHVNGIERHIEFDDIGDDNIIVESVTRRKRSGWAFDGGASFVFPELAERASQADKQVSIIVLPGPPKDVHATEIRVALGRGDEGRSTFFASMPDCLPEAERHALWIECLSALKPMEEIARRKVQDVVGKASGIEKPKLQVIDAESASPDFVLHRNNLPDLIVKYAGDTTGSNKFLARQVAKPARRLAVERRVIKHVAPRMDGPFLLPRVEHFDKERRILIIESISGKQKACKSWRTSLDRMPHFASLAGRFLGKLHCLPLPVEPFWGDAAQEREHWNSLIENLDRIASQQLEILGSQGLEQNLTVLAQSHAKERIMHLDYTLDNVIPLGDDIFITEFERAGSFGDNAYDVATLAASLFAYTWRLSGMQASCVVMAAMFADYHGTGPPPDHTFWLRFMHYVACCLLSPFFLGNVAGDAIPEMQRNDFAVALFRKLSTGTGREEDFFDALAEFAQR